MNWFVKLLLSSISIVITAYVLPGVTVDTFYDAVIVSLVLSIVNLLVKPIFTIHTIPITVITFGLFLLTINAFMIMFVGNLVDGFQVAGFWSALFFSFIFSILQSIFFETDK